MHVDKTLAPNETSIMNYMTGPGLNADKKKCSALPAGRPGQCRAGNALLLFTGLLPQLLIKPEIWPILLKRGY